jgi:hypothetical protein
MTWKMALLQAFSSTHPAVPRFHPARGSASGSVIAAIAHFGTSRPRRTAVAVGPIRYSGRSSRVRRSASSRRARLRKAAGCHQLGELASFGPANGDGRPPAQSGLEEQRPSAALRSIQLLRPRPGRRSSSIQRSRSAEGSGWPPTHWGTKESRQRAAIVPGSAGADELFGRRPPRQAA